MTSVAKKTAESLRALGVKYVLGVPSGNWVDFMEGLRTTEGIEFVLVSNEAAGGFMADVCWRLTGQIAACFGTFGPGACNLSTGVCCAFLDRSPMLVLADEMSDTMLPRITQMNIDHQSLFKPITKEQTRLQADQVKTTFYSAFQKAVAEVPGPVYIGLPAGIGTQPAAEEDVELPASIPLPPPKPEALEQMRELWLEARQPVMAVGITALRSHVRSLVRQAAEKFKIPVVQTPMAKGMISEDHPAYAGVLAHALGNHVGLTHQQADLVMGVGYDPVEINYEDWMPDVPLIHIDTIPADIDRQRFPVRCDVVGDLKKSLEYLLDIQGPAKIWDFEALAQRRSAMFAALSASADRFDPRTVLAGLREKLPKNGIMTCDVGAHLHLIGQAWKTYSPECQIMTNGGSSMGFGIPAAIAAKLCLPQRDIVCVTGDGGFLMMAGEMATAARLGTKVVFVVMSDQNLSLIRIKQERKNYPGYGTPLIRDEQTTSPSVSSSVFGVPVLTARNSSDYYSALDEAFASTGPVIIEAFVRKEDYADLILQGNK